MTLDQALQAGLTQHQVGNLHEAEHIYRQILAQAPQCADAVQLLGVIAKQVGQLTEAERLIRQAMAMQPGIGMYHSNLGEVLRLAGKVDEACEHARKAADLAPADPVMWFNLGVALFAIKRVDQAEEAFRKSVELNPNAATAWNNLGACREFHKQLADAIDCYHKGLAIAPTDASLHHNLAVALCGQGKLDEGIASYRKGLELVPSADRHSHLLYTLLHHPAQDMAAIFADHLAWARHYAEPITAASARPHNNDRSSERRLRVGYVSPNFRRHAVAFFSEPMLAAHDREQVEVFCYSDAPATDEVTQRFKGYADHWRDVQGVEDQELAGLIRRDAIDILVDLTGHIPGNRLLSFAAKPAPVQVTYLGYQATTGLSAMDYRLTDCFADPGGTERFYTEKLVRLPLFFVYRALDDSPDVNDLPALKNGYITFGSMNTFVKVSDPVIETWARLLQRLPQSRLMLLIPGGENGNDHVRRRFAQHDIPAERIDLVSTTDNRGYLELYHRIDIALDPFPFGGHTTTCDALWMGVPTVVLAGDHYVSRMGVSVMNAIGATDWIVSSKDEYVEKLITLASDVSALSEIRAHSRARLQNSPAMDAQGFTRSLEAAYREMWRAYCR